MFCTYCGKELKEDQEVCLSCGRLVFKATPKNQNQLKLDGKTIGTLSIVFGLLGLYPLIFIGSIIGAIFAIMGLKNPDNAYKKNCKIGLFISIVTFLIGIILIILYLMFLYRYFAYDYLKPLLDLFL